VCVSDVRNINGVERHCGVGKWEGGREGGHALEVTPAIFNKQWEWKWASRILAFPFSLSLAFLSSSFSGWGRVGRPL
jgi:hypothetical protein